jgi:hypothetical protein
VDRKNQILLISQSPGDTTSELHLYTNTRIGCLRNNSITFTKKLNFLLFLCLLFLLFLFCVCFIFFYITNFIVTIFLSLFLPPHFPSFSCATIHCFPSQLLFLPLFIHSFPCLQLALLSFPNQSPHYPFLLYIHHPLTSLLYQLYTTPAPCNS